GGPNRPAIHATDSSLVQLEPGAAPPPQSRVADSTPPIVSLAAVSEEDGPLLRVPLQPGDDPETAAEEANSQPGVAFAEPVYVYGADFVDGDGDPSPATGGDAPYVGSHVSGTIGATGDNRTGVVGVNWKVSLMALRGIGPQGGRSDALAKSIDYAVDYGARV